MRRVTLIAIVLACAGLANCGESAPRSTTSPPITTPTTPTPQPAGETYTLTGLAKEAWIDTGLPGVTVTVTSGPSRGFSSTDDQGRYRLPNLLPGVYSLTFSKPAPYTSQTYGGVNVTRDTTFNGAISITVGFPVTTANLQGYWVAQGPYPNEPCWILLIQNGTRLEGWYKDGKDYSTAMSGTYIGDAVSLDVGTSGLIIEGRVQDARCIRAVIKNEALGGNFPVTLSRGGNCAR